MSIFANYCLTHDELKGLIYTLDDVVILAIDNEENNRITLTLSPFQALTLAKGLQNFIAQMPVHTTNHDRLYGSMTLDFPLEDKPAAAETLRPPIEKAIICLEKKRPMA